MDLPTDLPHPDPDPSERRSVFAVRAFRLLFIGQIISSTGTWLQNVAQNSMVRTLSGGSFMVGVTQAAMFLPVLVLALPGGALADRFDRRRLLIATQLLAAAATLGLALVTWSHHESVAAVLVVAVLVGIQYAVAIPATLALLPSLVEPGQLGEAIGMNSITYNIARVLGPALLAAVIALGGYAGAFALNSLSFLALVAALLLMGRPRDAGPRAGGPIREALAFCRRDRSALLSLVAVTAVAVAWDPVVTLSPAVAASFPGHRPVDSGVLVMCFGVGAMASGLLLARVFRRATSQRAGYLSVSTAVFALGMAGYAFAPSFAFAAGSLVVAGAGFLIASTTWTTALQETTPPALLGRVMAVWTLCFLGSRPISAIVDGTLADLASTRAATLALLVPLVAATAFAMPALRSAAEAPPRTR
jgi:MFS family permease